MDITTLTRTGSHTVTESPHGRREGIDREEVFFYIATAWRGTPVTVILRADRYAHTGGVSDWRITVSDVRPDVSGTARQRLRERCEPLATDWLASDAYTRSESVAYASMIANTLRTSPYDATREVRRQLTQWASKLPTGIAAKLAACADAHDAYTRQLENTRAAIEAAGEPVAENL